MENGNPERRLAAIVAIDVVGYSRLMGADEAGTLKILKAHQQALTSLVEHHGGRLVSTAGDGILLEFPSVVEALDCSMKIQALMDIRNLEVADDKKMLFRIGINLGDIIIHTDNDVFGDGVNVAARIEQLAPAGGICISRSVRNQVRDKMDVNLEDMGEIDVKNITRPIRVFRVLKEGEVASKPPRKKSLWQKYAAAAAVLVALVGGGASLWWQAQPDFEPTDTAMMTFKLPEKPSIAVLPFDNLSDESSQEYFADGMTDDLITDLSKLSGLFVISRNSTFTYKNKAVKIRKVAEELGVRYVLEGSIRRIGDQVRINAQLIDALSGFHLWAERYDGSMTDVFQLQDRVIGQIVSALAVNLTVTEVAQKGNSETPVPAAYDFFLQGRDFFHRQTPQDYGKAISFFNKAIELDPGYSRAHAFLARIYYSVTDTNWDVHLGIEYKAYDLAVHHLALAMEKPNADALQLSAEQLYSTENSKAALMEIDRAIELEPNNPDSYYTKAWLLNLSGLAKEAENNVRLAMRLNPDHGVNYLRTLARAMFFQRRYDEAAKVFNRAVDLSPNYEFSYNWLAATNGHLGRIDEAKAAIAKYNELIKETIGDKLTVKNAAFLWGDIWKGLDSKYLELYLEGLRKAGVPEGGVTGDTKVPYKNLVSEVDEGYQVEGAVKIDVARAKTIFDRGVVFIDARGGGPYKRGHIPGAININISALSKGKLSTHVKMDEEVVFYCGGTDCPLAAHSSARALAWGYKKVYYFAAGFPGWKFDGGYEVEK